MSYRDRVSSPGPKKLLALDGGGIRGVITLEVLRRLESMLAVQVQRLDSVQHVGELRRVGQAAARDVALGHFAGFLEAAR